MMVKRLLIVFFIITTFLDIFIGSARVDGIEQYMSFLSPCIILVFYFLCTKNEDYSYMLSFVFVVFGLYFYNYTTLTKNEVGIYFFTFGLLVYLLKVWQTIDKSLVKPTAKKALPFLSILILPIIIVLNKVGYSLFLPILTYSLSLFVFIFFGVLKFLNKNSTSNKYLVISGTLLVASAILGAFVFYWEQNVFMRGLAIMTFNFGHLLMCFYVLEIQKENTSILLNKI